MSDTKSAVGKELNEDQVIALMGVYLEEWMHRDNLLWKQTFQYFYANLIVIVLPYIAEFLRIDLPEISPDLFPWLGIGMAWVFLYIGLGYVMRLRASSLTYERVMKKLGNEAYQRISIKNSVLKHDPEMKDLRIAKLFACQMSMVLVFAMFIALILVALILIFAV